MQSLVEPTERFFGETPPRVVLQKERPEHRMMIVLKAQGFSDKEIAEMLEVSRTTVGYVLKQDWARDRVLALINGAGKPVIQQLLAGTAVDRIYRLIELSDQDEDLSVARAATDSLLDRHLGKATQRVEQATLTINYRDITAINGQISALEQEIAQLTGGKGTKECQPATPLEAEPVVSEPPRSA